MPFTWIIISYLLGSIPFGFLISKFSGKNILEIGWKKTSGSNVYKNVGKLQGILTGILDIAKGYLAVWLVQRLGFSPEIQIFSGVAAILGHNWSLFLKFSGGRGIGTFAGAFLALAPKVFGFSLIPFVALALVWDAAIGTLAFFVAAIFLSAHFNEFRLSGVFTLLSLGPILIKRLSPVSEIKNSKDKFSLIRNRLIFDNDQFLRSFRINRIFQQKKTGKISLAFKIITAPFLLPPKYGWRIAKFGVNAAKKPLEKLISQNRENVVTELTVEDFKKMIVASSQKIVLHQEEINKINVFPVADKDTGYNMAATLLGIEGVISQKKYSTLRELTDDIKEAAMINARGNAGMILTGYLIEILDRIKHLESIDAFHLALAMKRGIKAARFSITSPVEGTILDVIKAAGNKAFEIAKLKNSEEKKSEKNIIKVLEAAYSAGEIALKETKEKLEVLKQNDVVDAGGLGFLKILEAWVESLKGIAPAPRVEVTSPVSTPEVLREGLKFKYEVVLSFKNEKGIGKEELRKELSFFGDSLEILELEGKIKFHIHTNQPDYIVEKFKGSLDLEYRVEDMEEELSKIKKRPLGLVVDEVADLPREFLEKNKIEEVPFTTRFPDGEMAISKEEIYTKMKEALIKGSPLPTTSAPTFQEFLDVYQRAFKKFEKILVITVSSKLSGTYSSARIARSVFKKPEKLNIYVFDCFTAEVGEGLIALRAQELISAGKKLEEVVEELKKFCPKITLIGCLDDFRYVVHGGRVRLPKIFVGPIFLLQKIGIRVLVGLKNGKVGFFGINLGKDVAKILAEEISKQSKGKEIAVAIAHADNLKAAEDLKVELEKEPKVKVLFISSVSPVVATHTGPGALLAAFYSKNIDK
ncbi:MAG: glycerol-3-phosphate acyltransferase [Candidatus Pacebacteria bacterium]|nr:glycerol-3-phosphate acyltransferase [Candidatus Paceibacterota bacterium]